eukprot:TRINITY_DN12390_c0_g1_i1.p1 TRINITY_DN12390_c0_g1~~TRINITY_DN12390_c0_g1_i1.p1  ORF type:complete len:285 (+),score=43.54 TRINITY_DN12390_c0_g1_i1:68-856(+)
MHLFGGCTGLCGYETAEKIILSTDTSVIHDMDFDHNNLPARNLNLPNLLITQNSSGDLGTKDLRLPHTFEPSPPGTGRKISQASTHDATPSEPFSAPSISSAWARDDESVVVEDETVLQRVLRDYKQQSIAEEVRRERIEAREREAETRRAMEEEERLALVRREALLKEQKQRHENKTQLRFFLQRLGVSAADEKRRSPLLFSFDYPLHVAAGNGDAQIVRALLEEGADKLRKNSRGLTPHMIAQQQNRDGSHDEVLCILAA